MGGSIKALTALQSCLPVWNQSFYVAKVKVLFAFLHENNWTMTASITAAFLIEPLNALYAGYLQAGLYRRKLENLNPIVLTKSQQDHNPLLLIHGDHSNSFIFNDMIKAIAEKYPQRPIYTVDLTSPDGIISEKQHIDELYTKINHIARVYSETPTLDIIGHSSGGDVVGPLAQRMMKGENIRPGALIKIGSAFDEKAAEEFNDYANISEYLARDDVFVGYRSHLPKNHIFPTGHIGLVFNNAVINKVLEMLKCA